MNHSITTLRSLLESDRKIRELERVWRLEGTVEREIHYYSALLRSRKRIELAEMSQAFTTSKLARKWYRKYVWPRGLWSSATMVRGRPMHAQIDHLGGSIRGYLDSKDLHDLTYNIEAIGFKPTGPANFLVYFTLIHESYCREVCVSIFVDGGITIVHASEIRSELSTLQCNFTRLTNTNDRMHKNYFMLTVTNNTADVWRTHTSTGQ